MGRILKIVALSIGLTALGILVFLGLAIWVFIPLLPAGIIYVIVLFTARRTAALRPRASETGHRTAASEADHRKAA